MLIFLIIYDCFLVISVLIIFLSYDDVNIIELVMQ